MRYGSVARKLFKSRWNLRGLVQDHHVIPKQHRNHPLVKEHLDINSSDNIIMMPTRLGMNTFVNIRKNRLVHGNSGHQEYNKFVKQLLDTAISNDELHSVMVYLKYNCRFDNTIPWERDLKK